MKFAKHTILFFLMLTFGLLAIFTNQLLNKKNSQDTLGINTTITAQVTSSKLTFVVYPEKRLPATNNWDTIVDITIDNCNSSESFTYTNINTNTQGVGTIPLNQEGLPAGSYSFYVTGQSHLSRQFRCQPIYSSNNYIDLTLENKYLLAGEVGIVEDNYINSLDMSVLINNTFTNNYTSDFNQDGRVNALDLSNQIFNLFIKGD